MAGHERSPSGPKPEDNGAGPASRYTAERMVSLAGIVKMWLRAPPSDQDANSHTRPSRTKVWAADMEESKPIAAGATAAPRRTCLRRSAELPAGSWSGSG